MHDGMQYDPIQRQGHKPWKLEIRQFTKAISSAIYNGSWQLATDSYTRAFGRVNASFMYESVKLIKKLVSVSLLCKAAAFKQQMSKFYP